MKGAGTYPYKRRVSDKKMKNSELKEYLNSFPDDTEVSVIIANTKARKRYPLTDYHSITNMEQPVFLLEIGNRKIWMMKKILIFLGKLILRQTSRR